MRVNIATACACAAACSTSEKLDVVLLLDSDLFEAAPLIAEELLRLESVINAPDARYAMVSVGSKDIFASSDNHWVYKRESFFSDDLVSVSQRLLDVGRPHDYNNSPLSAIADALACCVHDQWLGYREDSRKVFVLLTKGFTLSSEDFSGWLLPDFSCSALSISQSIDRLTWLRELRELDDGFFWSVYDFAEDNEAKWFDEYLGYLPYWFYAKEADGVPRQLEQVVSEAMCAVDLTPWVPFDLPTFSPNPPPSTTASGGTSDKLNNIISDAKTAGGVAVLIASAAAALYSVTPPGVFSAGAFAAGGMGPGAGIVSTTTPNLLQTMGHVAGQGTFTVQSSVSPMGNAGLNALSNPVCPPDLPVSQPPQSAAPLAVDGNSSKLRFPKPFERCFAQHGLDPYTWRGWLKFGVDHAKDRLIEMIVEAFFKKTKEMEEEFLTIKEELMLGRTFEDVRVILMRRGLLDNRNCVEDPDGESLHIISAKELLRAWTARMLPTPNSETPASSEISDGPPANSPLQRLMTQRKSHFELSDQVTDSSLAGNPLQRLMTKRKSHLELSDQVNDSSLAGNPLQRLNTKRKSHFDSSPEERLQVDADAADPPANLPLQRLNTKRKSHLELSDQVNDSSLAGNPPLQRLNTKRKSHFDSLPEKWLQSDADASPSANRPLQRLNTKRKSHFDSSPEERLQVDADAAGPSANPPLRRLNTKRKSHLDSSPEKRLRGDVDTAVNSSKDPSSNAPLQRLNTKRKSHFMSPDHLEDSTPEQRRLQ